MIIAYFKTIASYQPDQVISRLADLGHQLWQMVGAFRYPDLREACAIWINQRMQK